MKTKKNSKNKLRLIMNFRVRLKVTERSLLIFEYQQLIQLAKTVCLNTRIDIFDEKHLVSA